MIDHFTSVLNYGVIGVSLMLAYFGYRILSKLVQNANLKNVHVILLSVYFLFCFGMVILGFILEFHAKDSSDSLRQKYLGGVGQNAFVQGGEGSEAFSGFWKARYFVLIDGAPFPTNIFSSEKVFNADTLAKYLKEYPQEHLSIDNDHSIMYVKARGNFGETNSKFTLWGEGRYSSGADLTFIYWSPIEESTDQFVGVNFMHFSKSLKLQAKTILNGWWIGRSETGEIVHGVTIWEKEEL